MSLSHRRKDTVHVSRNFTDSMFVDPVTGQEVPLSRIEEEFCRALNIPGTTRAMLGLLIMGELFVTGHGGIWDLDPAVTDETKRVARDFIAGRYVYSSTER